jgi:hypothetical protein
MYFYKNVFNTLWKYLVKFEMDSMIIKYSKSLLENVTSVFIAERISQNS